ncbi:hypothetical protein B0H14DRAFT_2646691 [Mycena olivaceomarginata]|nr:hypothetical protein B0H14DRAFT_2646691 [Mycena olivaceomarginata]
MRSSNIVPVPLEYLLQYLLQKLGRHLGNYWTSLVSVLNKIRGGYFEVFVRSEVHAEIVGVAGFRVCFLGFRSWRCSGCGSRIPECNGARVMHGAGIELIGGVRGAVGGEVGAADSGQILSLFQRLRNKVVLRSRNVSLFKKRCRNELKTPLAKIEDGRKANLDRHTKTIKITAASQESSTRMKRRNMTMPTVRRIKNPPGP